MARYFGNPTALGRALVCGCGLTALTVLGLTAFSYWHPRYIAPPYGDEHSFPPRGMFEGTLAVGTLWRADNTSPRWNSTWDIPWLAELWVFQNSTGPLICLTDPSASSGPLPRWSGWYFYVNGWLAGGLLAIYPAVPVVRRAILVRRRRRRGLCLTCGYNLTGNVSGVCPECGAAAGSPAGASPSKRSRR